MEERNCPLCSQLSYTPIGECYSNRSVRKMQVFSLRNLKNTAKAKV